MRAGRCLRGGVGQAEAVGYAVPCECSGQALDEWTCAAVGHGPQRSRSELLDLLAERAVYEGVDQVPAVVVGGWAEQVIEILQPGRLGLAGIQLKVTTV